MKAVLRGLLNKSSRLAGPARLPRLLNILLRLRSPSVVILNLQIQYILIVSGPRGIEQLQTDRSDQKTLPFQKMKQ
jgi:hypothetical protein